MSFAYQGFGFGEFFKAQQKLEEILEACFLGVFDAPSKFLSLARTLEQLEDAIEHLFDENSNPNSAILRSDNREDAQQMLRITSHGLIDCLRDLEVALPIDMAKGYPPELRGYNMVMVMKIAGEEGVFDDLIEKFSYQAWKLEYLFKVLRKSKIAQTLVVYDPVRARLSSFLEDLTGQKASSGLYETRSGSSSVNSEAPSQSFDTIGYFQDACQFGRGINFTWKLKAESTLLIILHWVFHLSRNNNTATSHAEVYVNLIKCAWLLDVSSPDLDSGGDGYSDELRTLIGLLGCEVVYQLQEYSDKDLEQPTPEELRSRGNFNIYVDGVKRDPGGSILKATTPPVRSTDRELQHSPKPTTPNSGHRPDTRFISNAFDFGKEVYPGIGWTRTDGGSNNEVPSPGTEDDISARHSEAPIEPSKNDNDDAASIQSSVSAQRSLSSARRRSGGVPTSDHYFGMGSPKLFSRSRNSSDSATPPMNSAFDPAYVNSVPKVRALKPKATYRWTEVVDRAQLGVRPGEVEILPKFFEYMQLLASYTGDTHGRWDDCRLRIFKSSMHSTMRILTIMEGSDESIDQRYAKINEAEVVPEYAYQENHPIIYIRKTLVVSGPKASTDSVQKSVEPSSLFYKFRNAHDMFNFQLALLGESVETDFQTVRTVRYKKSRSIRDNEYSHYRTRIQLWREQGDESDRYVVNSVSSASSVASSVPGSARQTSKAKVHAMRVVMYWDESITTLFVTDSVDVELRTRKCAVRIRPSSHKAFNNPTTIKARTIGSRDAPGGFRLDHKGLCPEDEENFDDFKWFEIEFNTAEEMNSFYAEFKRALNTRRKERWHADELARLAARGVVAGQHLNISKGLGLGF